MTPLLELEDVHARYGPIKALHGVTLTVDDGQIAAVLGANGAGKTTTLRAISNTVKRAGKIRFAGKPLGRGGPESVAKKGIAHVPEGRGTFSELTVTENLRLGAHTRRGSIKDDLQRVYSYFPWLEDRGTQEAGTLSGGEQQMLAIARALMANPRVLLMDEPSEGLAPQIVAEVMTTIRRLKEQGLSIVLVEQNAKLVFDVADDIVILNSGHVVVDAPTAELKAANIDLHQHLGIY